MKTMFMAAGKGERLGKITQEIPKCLVSIGGVPLLNRWFDKFNEWKFSDILINICHKQDKILEHLKTTDWDGIRISIFREETPLGTAKTMFINRKFVKGEYYFGVVYADVWTTFDLRKMITFHKRRPSVVTLGLHIPKTYEGKGIAVIRDGIVVGFEEKPQNNQKSKFVWAGIMIAHPSIFSCMTEGMKDIATDLLPKLAQTGKMSAFFINDPLIDIGTPESLKEADELAKGLGFKSL